jgi:hypothetical protein
VILLSPALRCNEPIQCSNLEKTAANSVLLCMVPKVDSTCIGPSGLKQGVRGMHLQPELKTDVLHRRGAVQLVTKPVMASL